MEERTEGRKGGNLKDRKDGREEGYEGRRKDMKEGRKDVKEGCEGKM